MRSHALSHGAATLATVIAAPLIVEVMRAQVPVLIGPVERIAKHLIQWLSLKPPLTMSMITTLLVAATLAAMWGAIFALLTRE